MNNKQRNTVSTLIMILFLSFSTMAQTSECKDKLVIFEELAKKNNYNETTYQPWLELKKTCGETSEFVYQSGAKILTQKVDMANTAAEKSKLITELVALYDEHDKVFPENKNGNRISKALLLYENKTGDSKEIFAFLDKSFKADKSQFVKSEVLNLYGDQLISQYHSKETEINLDQVLETLDQISERIQIEKNKQQVLVDKYALKVQTEPLSAEEKIQFETAKISNDEFSLTDNNNTARISKLSNCEVLIAFYQKKLDANLENALWLERVYDQLDEKKCKSDFSAKVLEKLHSIKPNAKSAYAMAVAARAAKNKTATIDYFIQSANLEKDTNKKAETLYVVATTYGFSEKTKAREFANKALEIKPTFGKSYIFISQLYANSVKECGSDSRFNGKALYWLAAETAKKAGVVEPMFKKSADDLVADYLKKAPTKLEAKEAKRKSGDQISYNCWIGESVTIPKL